MSKFTGWFLAAVLLLSGTVSAAIATYYGSVIVPSGGTLAVNSVQMAPQKGQVLYTFASLCAAGAVCSANLTSGSVTFTPNYALPPVCFASTAPSGGDTITPLTATPNGVGVASFGIALTNAGIASIAAAATVHVNWWCD